MNFFKKIWGGLVKVGQVFEKLVGKDNAQKFAQGALALLKSEAGMLAVAVVQAVEASNPLATPADKRQAAYDQLGGQLKSRGLETSSALLNLLIEVAVTVIKGYVVAA